MTVDTTAQVPEDAQADDQLTPAEAAGDDADGAAKKAPRPGKGRRIALAGLIAALVALSGVLGYFLWDAKRETSGSQDLRGSALEAATAYGELIGTYSYDKLDENFQAVADVATPEFAEEYETIANELREVLTTGEGVSKGTVIEAAVQSANESRARVLLFLNQEVRNKVTPDGRTDASRLIVDLAREGDRWLLLDVQAV